MIKSYANAFTHWPLLEAWHVIRFQMPLEHLNWICDVFRRIVYICARAWPSINLTKKSTRRMLFTLYSSTFCGMMFLLMFLQSRSKQGFITLLVLG